MNPKYFPSSPLNRSGFAQSSLEDGELPEHQELPAQEFAETSDRLYLALVPLLTIPFTALISNSYPALSILQLLSHASPSINFTVADDVFQWTYLAVIILMLLVFYELGKRLDFARDNLRLVCLCFVGSFLGNLPGYYAWSTSGGTTWGSGFGYVRSNGFPEPAGIVGLIAAAVATFMIPVAGLALAQFSFLDRPGEDPHSRSTMRFSVAAFLILLVSFPVTELGQRLLFPHPPAPFSPLGDVLLLPGYFGFLVYPIAFLGSLYLIGHRSDLRQITVKSFAASIFIVSFIAILLSFFIGTYIANPNSPLQYITSLNVVETLSSDVILSSVVVIMGFAAASLGFFRGDETP